MVKTETINTKVPIYSLDGKLVDNIQLDGELFNGKVNKSVLYATNRMYEANLRQGTVSTKTRAEVSGGGIKPWRQKGTGRARVGSTRNPLWRHGGVAFGPKMRDHRYSVPKKVVKGALLSALNARLLEQGVKLIAKIELKTTKTKEFNSILTALKTSGKTLVIVDKLSRSVKLSSRNIENVDVKEAASTNARDILLHNSLIIEKEALECLVERLR